MKSKRIVAIIQAHMSSSRLPGKILLDMAGAPILYRVVECARSCTLIDEVVVATSTLPCDDIICEKCAAWGVPTVRGSDSDVLSRYEVAVNAFPADVYVRLTSDDPLLCAALMDDALSFFLSHDYRYVAIDNDTIPLGLGCEIFSAELFREAVANSTEAYEHEHVTPYMYTRQPSMYRLSGGGIGSQYRLTVDTPEDYEVLKAVFAALYAPNKPFVLQEVADWLQAHPEIAAINRNIRQKHFTETKSE